MRNGKVFRQLVDAIGSRCTLILSNGDEVTGILCGFRWSPLILSIDGSIDGGSRVLVNFRYVLKLKLGE